MSDTKKWWEEPTKAPEIAPAPTAPKLEYKNWLDTEQGKGANTKRQEAETALNKHGDFSFLQQDWMDQVLSDIKNRADFSYNFNEDALYQQYKDKYIKQGKMAMADTIGQASAMTGGYGNSYAQSVGQQAYQASLENLNDIVPELYQMAYDRYQQEGQDLYNQYGLLMEEYKKQYGEHSDEYNKLLTALNRADSEFYNGANLHQTEQSMANSVAQNNWQNDFSIWDANNQNAWTKAQWDESARQYAEQMALAKQQASYGSSGGNGGSGGNVVVDENGNLKVENTSNSSSLPSDVIKKFEGFTSNEQIMDYALGLKDGGYDPAEVDKMVKKLLDPNEKYIEDEEEGKSSVSYKEMAKSTQGWKVVSKGGGNLLGIDKNARVIAPNGEEMSLEQLRKKLEGENMKTSEANKLIKALQQNLGISSNWLFGW